MDAPPTAPTRVDRAKWWLDAVKIEKLYMAPRYAGCLMIGVGTGASSRYGAERLRHWLQTLAPAPARAGRARRRRRALLGAARRGGLAGMGRQTATSTRSARPRSRSPRTSPPRCRPAAGSAARARPRSRDRREVTARAACRPGRAERALRRGRRRLAPARLPRWRLAGFRDPLQTVAAALATANAPATGRRARAPAGARARARAWPAGPRFPRHWLVLQTLASCSCVGVALVTALHATTGARHPAAGILVGMTACALCLAGVVVSDVADLQAGMYTTDTNLAPALARLRPLLASLTAAKS